MNQSTPTSARPLDNWSEGKAKFQQRHDEGPSATNQEQLSFLAQEARSQAAAAVEPMKEKAREVFNNQKNVLADRIGGLANALDAAAQQFATESPAAGEMLHGAAGSIKNASALLREKRTDELSGAITHFARNQPAALFAGAVVAGFAISRFLKSSAPEHSGPAGS